MSINLVTSAIRADREFSHLLDTLGAQMTAPKPLPIAVSGLSGAASDAALAELVKEARDVYDKTALIITDTEKDCRRLAALLSEVGLIAATYPYRDFVFHAVTASHGHDRERLCVLHDLAEGKLDAVIATPAAALQYTMPAPLLQERAISLSVGDSVSLDDICARLLKLGFSSAELTEGTGQFSRRGGVLDVFCQEEGQPVRMEFFGDEIDRMGYFSPLTQRMSDPCATLTVLPAREVILSDDVTKELIKRLRRMTDGASKKKTAPEGDAAQAALRQELALLEAGMTPDAIDKYICLAYPEKWTLLSYFIKTGRNVAGRTPLLIAGTAAMDEGLSAHDVTAREAATSLITAGLVEGALAEYAEPADAFRDFAAKQATVHVNPFSEGPSHTRLSGLFGFRCRRGVVYAGNIGLLKEDLQAYLKTSYRTLVLTENAPAQKAVLDALLEAGLPATALNEEGAKASFDGLTAGVVYVAVGHFSGGFELLTPRVAVLSMQEQEEKAVLRKKHMLRAAKRVGAGEKILSYADLKVGDYVVHAVHGIGQFAGMETLRTDGALREYITIRYMGTDKLFLPAERLEMISKYIGGVGEDGTVKLSRLGGTDWQRARQKAKSAARDMAKELIALYAARQRRKGYAFPEDGALEEEFDSAFSFEETDAQLVAIREIKADMEKPVPMDRLLCGDVGYGKTEVALRAAFKAVVAGKQVALLVPTTILALQHYQTVLSRMRGHAVSVEMLSRFRKPKEQAEILRRLRRGDIDFIIGTHSLLGPRVEFKDLGLLIVDEEQRFGVAQKERIKQMAEGIDVLTLTATPIPRTLNMAMSGIRDMSLLDEAPVDRYPVQTYVLEHDDEIILDAIRREVGRGGQVLYLYNRTGTIADVAARISARMPDAHVTFAHGQMERKELEDIWQDMVNGTIDVLVCTTIVETGVDLPNANTLIIEGADRMGLSQLHQLRGRVGRSGRHAYAYFTYRQGKVLTEIAEKRLEAIREYAGFGAGFKIALRDLEIRGAGNILGAEQHGHIDSVGYDMYIRLLNEAILEEKGEAPTGTFEAVVNFAGDAHIPEGYLASPAQRMEMYKKISLVLTEEDMSDVLDEFCDRFGEPPKPVVRLLYASLCRALAAKARFPKVEQTGNELRFFAEELSLDVWSEMFAEDKTLRFAGGVTPSVRCRIPTGVEAAKHAVAVLTKFLLLRQALKKETEEKGQEESK